MSGVQVLSRAAQILRLVGGASDGLRPSDLTSATDLPKSTVHRVVRALEDEGLLTTTGDGRIVLGTGLAALGQQATAAVVDQLGPITQRLHDRTGETVDVSVLERGAARFVDQIQSTHALRAVSAVGASFPLDTTANGKALLAALPPDEVARLLGEDHALAMRDELDAVRASGIAVDDEEHTPGICALGIAIVRAGRPLCAISVPVPAGRFADVRADVTAALLRARDEAGARLPG